MGKQHLFVTKNRFYSFLSLFFGVDKIEQPLKRKGRLTLTVGLKKMISVSCSPVYFIKKIGVVVKEMEIKEKEKNRKIYFIHSKWSYSSS